MNERRPTSPAVALLLAALLALVACVAAQLLTRPAGAVGLLESAYQPWPAEAIAYATPVDGWYALMEHRPAGPRRYAAWYLEAGLSATTMLPAGPAGTVYHIQVMEGSDGSHILLETARYRRAAQVAFLPLLLTPV
jgi:hypothetical protein